jgi:hypothetical protein
VQWYLSLNDFGNRKQNKAAGMCCRVPASELIREPGDDVVAVGGDDGLAAGDVDVG